MAARTEHDVAGRLADFIVVTGLRPSFVWGAASLWDFPGLMRPRVRLNPKMVNKTVAEALAEDWESVGRDMWRALPAQDRETEDTPGD